MDQPSATGDDTNPLTSAAASTAVQPIEVAPRSPSPQPLPEAESAHPFGEMLGPVLLSLCSGRLADLQWFRTDWQRGGALTGYATWTDDQQSTRPVVVKFPVPPNEKYWLVQLATHPITPNLYAHGSELGGYDLAWVVMERLPHGPLASSQPHETFPPIAQAIASFYNAARSVPLGEPRPKRDWPAQLKQARDRICKVSIPNSQRWRKALKAAGKKLPAWLDAWHARDTGYWVHGDLHPGNAMSRDHGPDGPAVLFDLASVRRGHWVEDAVYLEQLYWTHPNASQTNPPAKLIAKALKEHRLTPGDNWPQLANVYRALLAMSAPNQLNKPGGNAYAAAALHVLERLV